MWWSKAKAFQAKRPMGLERGGDALEGPTAVSPGRQVQERAEWAVDQSRRLVEGQVAHVSKSQVEFYARLGRASPGLREHRRRGVDADNSPAGCLRDRDRDPAVAHRKLDQRPNRCARELDVKDDVGCHVSRPFRVTIRERLVPAHRRMLRRQPVADAAGPGGDALSRDCELLRERLVGQR